VEDPTTTLLVPQGGELKVDAYQNYMIRRS
jgi:hypothetical protein